MSSAEEQLEALIRRAPESTDDLIRLLTEGLGWPAASELTTEDMFAWTPEEFHLDPTKLATLRSVQQIPPLVEHQSFGVFLLQFEGDRLPIGAIRRLVSKLARRKKASANPATHPVWDLDDLLFFCQSSGAVHAMHVVALRDVGGKRVVRTISWSSDTTPTRMDLLVQRAVPDLRWANGGPAISVEIEAGAFTGYRETIKTAKALAAHMAAVAQGVREEVLALYDVEIEGGPMRVLFGELRKRLIADLTPDQFADVYAQTMVYGLLTARITHPEDFKGAVKTNTLSFDNRFLDAIYARFQSESENLVDIDELGLGNLADDLAATDIDQLLADFGTKDRRDDPVVHFYEDFLSQYDPAQQIELGVYYTPQPVVQHQIRAIDNLLKDKFGLPLGVADPTTWASYCNSNGMSLPKHVNPDQPFVSMLDPATGTGTYLVEWLRIAEENIREDAASRGLGVDAQDAEWRMALASHVLPSMAAFEISLASYTVAHLKLALQIPADLRDSLRLPIYLTDTLAKPGGVGQLSLDEDPISEEGLLADAVKRDRPVTIVVGNPPYRERASGFGGVVTQTAASRDSPSLSAFREPGNGRVEYKLHNLNIYFWRWATWKALDQHQHGGGIVSLITTSPYISGAPFAGMRRYLRETSDVIRLINCTPEGHQPEVPTRLFPGVQQPLAIMTIASLPSSDEASDFSCCSVAGLQKEKFDALAGKSLAWEAITGSGTEPLSAQDEAWTVLPTLPDVMPFACPGVKTNRSWVIAPHREVLYQRWQVIADASAVQVGAVMKSTGDRNAVREFEPFPGRGSRGSIAKDRAVIEAPVVFSFRAFDRQHLIPDGRVVDRARPPLWRSCSDEQIFVSELHTEPLRPGPGLLFTSTPPENSFFKGSGGGRAFPLWMDSGREQENISPGFLTVWSDLTGINLDGFSWVRYLAGICGTAAYQRHFSEGLKSPGVRVPVSTDPSLVARAQTIGDAVLWCNTFGLRGSDPTKLNLIPSPQQPKLKSQPSLSPGEIPEGFGYDEELQTLTFGSGAITDVTPEVLLFTTSGMPVVRHWFGYRKLKPSGKSSGVLSEINADAWSEDWTTELMEILTSLSWLIALEEVADGLLREVMSGGLLDSW